MIDIHHLLLVLLPVTLVNGKIYDRCELARELRLSHGLSEYEAAMWTCIAEKQSTLDTSSLTGSGAQYHGIFGISDEFWCAPPDNAYVCGLNCASLRDDDITDDLQCVRSYIYEEHQRISGDGFNAWPSYQSFCKYNWQGYASECLSGVLSKSDAIASSFAKSIASQYGSTPPTTTTSTVRPVDNNQSPPLYHHQSPSHNVVNSEADAIALSFAKSIANRQKSARSQLEVYEPRKVQARAKIYEPCELADELFNRHSVPFDQIPTWVCIAKHESNFDTSVVGRLNWDGSTDHGIFQISALYWCSLTGAGKACNAACSDFEDEDIGDDVACIKQIHAEHQRLSGDGFNAWAVYKPHCQGDVSSYIETCPIVNTIVPIATPEPMRPRPAITAPPKPYSTKVAGRGKKYSACELADELFSVYSFPLDQISTWVCIAYHESSYDTAAVGRLNWDGSGDHGLFQISDLYWCDEDGPGKACNAACSDFEDNDIADDVQCVKKIYDEHERLFGDGFHAWTVYESYCKGHTQSYIQGCSIDNEVVSPYEKGQDRTTKALWSPYTSPPKSKKPRGKVYDRCELARELYEVHRLPWDQVGTWTCIAEYESSYNTAAVGSNQDHGLFQISQIYWCGQGYPGKACNVDCADLEDNDLTDDIQCIRRIYDEHTLISGDGFNAWTVYKPRCKGRSANYVADCFAQPTQSTYSTYSTADYSKYYAGVNRVQAQTKPIAQTQPPRKIQTQPPRRVQTFSQRYSAPVYSSSRTTGTTFRLSKQILQNTTSTTYTYPTVSTTQRTTTRSSTTRLTTPRTTTTTRRPISSTTRRTTRSSSTQAPKTSTIRTSRTTTTSRPLTTTTRKSSTVWWTRSSVSTTPKTTSWRSSTTTTRKPSTTSLKSSSRSNDITKSTWRSAFDVYLGKSTKALPTFKPYKFSSQSLSTSKATTTTRSTTRSTTKPTNKPKAFEPFTPRTVTTRSPTTTKRSTTTSKSTVTRSSQNVIRDDSDKPKNAWEWYVKYVLKGKDPSLTRQS